VAIPPLSGATPVIEGAMAGSLQEMDHFFYCRQKIIPMQVRYKVFSKQFSCKIKI